jgi:hypothetical protein
VSILTILLLASTVLCTFNVWFYVRFWFHVRTWTAALLALFPIVFLASRALELRRIEADMFGLAYVTPQEWRILVCVLGLIACGTQTIAVFFRYDKLLKEIRAEKEKKGNENGTG